MLPAVHFDVMIDVLCWRQSIIVNHLATKQQPRAPSRTRIKSEKLGEKQKREKVFHFRTCHSLFAALLIRTVGRQESGNNFDYSICP